MEVEEVPDRPFYFLRIGYPAVHRRRRYDVSLPSFAEGHGCKPVDECEVGTRRSLGEGGCASAFAVRSRLRPTKVGGFRPTKCVERCHGRKAVGLHVQRSERGFSIRLYSAERIVYIKFDVDLPWISR
jgi:hypothetical protein